MTVWTEQKVAALKRMNADGLSFTDIGAELGFTRGAVGGKLHRMGLTMGRAKSGRRGARRSPADYRAAKPLREAEAASIRAKFEAVEIVDLPPDQSAVAVSFFRLNKETCRWPLGDPRDLQAMRFCGADHREGYPYCKRHCRMAYQPLHQKAFA